MNNCTTCKHFHKGLRKHFPNSDPSIIGECDHPDVPTRICVNYGMLCNGDKHEPHEISFVEYCRLEWVVSDTGLSFLQFFGKFKRELEKGYGL